MKHHWTTITAAMVAMLCAVAAAQDWTEVEYWNGDDGSQRSVPELAPFFPGLRPQVECPVGWWLVLGQCEDVNECRDPNNRPCFGLHTVCRNTPGSYRCQCLPRHTGDPYSFVGCQQDAEICSPFTTTTVPTTDTAITTTATSTTTTTASTIDTSTTVSTTAASTTVSTTTASTTVSTTAASTTVSTTATSTTVSTTAASTTVSTTAASTTVSTTAVSTAVSTTPASTTVSTTTASTTVPTTTTTASTTVSTTAVSSPVSTTAASTTVSTTAASSTVSTTAASTTVSTTAGFTTDQSTQTFAGSSTDDFTVDFNITTESPVPEIPIGYSRCLLNTEDSTSFYRLHTLSNQTWSEANDICRQDHPNANLAKIADESINDCLKTWFLFHTNVYYSWIGLRWVEGDSGEFQFRWTDGTLAAGVYENWGRNEPLNPSERQCVRLYSLGGFWETDVCSNLHAFFCQITV